MSNRILLIGIFCSCLIASLILTDLIPSFIMALLFLAMGTGLGFFIALSSNRLQQLQENEQMFIGLRSILMQKNRNDFNEYLAQKISRVGHYKDYHVILIGEDNQSKKWESSCEIIQQTKSPFLAERSQQPEYFKQLDADTKNFAGWPLYTDEKLDSIIFLTNFYGVPSLKKLYDKRIEHIMMLAAVIRGNDYLNAKESAGKERIFKVMASAWEQKDETFSGHSERVAELALLLGTKLRLTADECQDLFWGAYLHDIGREAELASESSCGESTAGIIEHTVKGAELFPDEECFKNIREIILYHHEHYDGSGPHGLKHNDIPQLARIVALADFYDALRFLSPQEEDVFIDHASALAELKKGSGSYFDPLALVALEEI